MTDPEIKVGSRVRVDGKIGTVTELRFPSGIALVQFANNRRINFPLERVELEDVKVLRWGRSEPRA